MKMEKISCIVTKQESGMTLQAYLKSRLQDPYSNREIKRAIENNQCYINNRIERHASTVVGSGDQIYFWINKSVIQPTKTSFEKERILYEDTQLLIYNKPAGITSDSKGMESLINLYTPAILTHRLDRDTTGVLIFTKDKPTFNIMVELFSKQKVYKTYKALVNGIPNSKEGIIENYLGKVHSYQGQGLWGSVDKKRGLYAYTEWMFIKSGKGASLLRCHPITGRTHQLRSHLCSIGHPILGDYQYHQESQSTYRPSRCLLHAAEVRFTLPWSGKELHIPSPLPEDFQKAMHFVEIPF